MKENDDNDLEDYQSVDQSAQTWLFELKLWVEIPLQGDFHSFPTHQFANMTEKR